MASPALQTLLEVQGLDTRTDQLTRRRATLPERAELTALETELRRLAAALDSAATRAHELGRAQKRLEDEISLLEDKVAATDRQLYSGSVTVPRELQALQSEATSLRSRIGAREDELLAGMEELEPVAAESARLAAAQDAASTQGEVLRAAIAEAEAAIDAELAEVAASRAGLVADVPAATLAQYERIRARTGGVGIARLDGHRCSGCNLDVPNREVDELRRAAPDQVVLHEECGRILVRD